MQTIANKYREARPKNLCFGFIPASTVVTHRVERVLENTRTGVSHFVNETLPFPVVGQFEFLPLCVTNYEIQTDPLPHSPHTRSQLLHQGTVRNNSRKLWQAKLQDLTTLEVEEEKCNVILLALACGMAGPVCDFG